MPHAASLRQLPSRPSPGIFLPQACASGLVPFASNPETSLNRRPSRAWALLLLAAAACRSDLSSQPAASNYTISVASGDAQQADPEDRLEAPVTFRVLDTKGGPVANATVRLSVPIGGGNVPASTLITDGQGLVSTAWTMGAASGVQTLQAQLSPKVTATASARTCTPDECFPASRISESLGGASLLSLATYEASGQTVHPDVARGHGLATGWWLAITPYPGGNSGMENPSVFHSHGLVNWDIPTGATNPVEFPPSAGYLSDPDIVWNTDQRLWLYYRAVVGNQNIINLVRSNDGVHWTAPITVLTAPSHMVVSPSVVRGAPSAPWQMWSVNSGVQGCTAPQTAVERRTSSDGVIWSAPVPINLVQPGRAIWHIDVEWIAARAEYLALYNTYALGTSCATDALNMARSPDGVHWTAFPSPIARAGVINAFKHLIYRSTFITDAKATRVTLWISGAAFDLNTGYTWQTATVTTSIASLFALASAPAAIVRADPSRRNLPPPERDLGP